MKSYFSAALVNWACPPPQIKMEPKKPAIAELAGETPLARPLLGSNPLILSLSLSLCSCVQRVLTQQGNEKGAHCPLICRKVVQAPSRKTQCRRLPRPRGTHPPRPSPRAAAIEARGPPGPGTSAASASAHSVCLGRKPRLVDACEFVVSDCTGFL